MNWDKVIFLAHASEDKEQVRYFCTELLDSGLHPWLDERELKPGDEWESKIKEAIRNARFFIAFLSHRSIVKNGFYQKELRFALAQMEEKAPKSGYIIPALLSPIDIPDITVGTVNLKKYHSVQLYEPYRQQGLIRLIDELHDKINNSPVKFALKNNLSKKLKIASSVRQLSLFNISKAQLEQEYTKDKIRRIETLLSFDFSLQDHFQPSQEDEIRFWAGMLSFSDAAQNTSAIEFLADKLQSIEIWNLSDLYFDMIQLCWKKFSERESMAIEKYIRSVEIDELVDLLEERIEAEVDYEEDEEQKQRLLDRIDRLIANLKDNST